MLEITPELALDESELEERFVRSPGPGGQNVNKVATAVQLRFDLACSPSVPEEVRLRALRLAGKRVTKEGILLIEARRFRTQERNRQDARERLVRLLQRAAVRPRPRKRTRPSAAAKKRRLDQKRRRGETKRSRRSPPAEG